MSQFTWKDPGGGGISEEALAEIEKTRPDLVAQYRQKMAKPNTDVQTARTVQDIGSIANTAGSILTNFSNANKPDQVILHNRMDRLGSAPTVKEVEDRKYDDSIISDATSRNLSRAKEDQSQASSDFFTEQKLTDRDQALQYKDPKSAKSKAYQDSLRALAPGVAAKMGPALDGLSADDIERTFPKLAATLAKSSGGSSSKASDWQVLSVSSPDGKTTRYINYNKLTGEKRDIDVKGYSPKFVQDPYTGAYTQLTPGSRGGGSGVSATPVGGGASAGTPKPSPSPAPKSSPSTSQPVVSGPQPGETPVQYKARVEVETQAAKKQAEEGGKRENAVIDAEADAAARRRVSEEMVALYNDASKEGELFDGTGPIDGRIAQLKNKLGMSHGQATDELNVRTAAGLADYIKDRSGTAASEGEVKRLQAIMPSTSDDRELFTRKLEAAMKMADEIVAKNRAKAGMVVAPEKKEVKRQYSPSRGQTKITYSDGSEEVIDGK
jgi:hypothetical protein